ncbi:PRC-barrel domain-containing protein [Azospirillum sp.]|uniref:PRC-barrel domain-containing protein n=1 Tax=Azospirillum sp. TaxID=34012 RepID=UPI003D7506C6
MKRVLFLTAATALFLAAPAVAQTDQSPQGDLASQQRPSLLRPDSLVGREVLSEDGEKVGTVDDVITASDSAAPRMLTIQGSDYHGMDGKRVAVDYGFRDLDVRGDWVVVKDVAAQEIAALPRMEGAQDAVSLRRSGEAPDPMKLRNRH